MTEPVTRTYRITEWTRRLPMADATELGCRIVEMVEAAPGQFINGREVTVLEQPWTDDKELIRSVATYLRSRALEIISQPPSREEERQLAHAENDIHGHDTKTGVLKW